MSFVGNVMHTRNFEFWPGSCFVFLLREATENIIVAKEMIKTGLLFLVASVILCCRTFLLRSAFFV